MASNSTSPNDSPASATEGTIDRAMQGANTMVGSAAEKAGPAVDQLRAGIDGAMASVRNGVDQLSETQQRWAASCRTCVREHPLASLGFAVAAGMLLSRLLRR